MVEHTKYIPIMNVLIQGIHVVKLENGNNNNKDFLFFNQRCSNHKHIVDFVVRKIRKTSGENKYC